MEKDVSVQIQMIWFCNSAAVCELFPYMARTALQRIYDFGENPPSLCVERASFGSYPKAFELLKGHLAVSSRTQTSAFSRMRELPSRAVRVNTDRQTSSSGCKIRVKWKTKKGFLPVPTYATLCQRLPVAKNMVQVCKQILYFACAFIRTASHQQVFVNEYRQFYMNIFS